VVCRSTSCTVCRCRRASEPRPTAPLTRSRKPTSSTSSSTIPTVRCRLCPAGSTELSRVRLSVRRSRTPLLQVCCCGPGGRVMSIYWCTAVAQRAVPRCQLMDVGRVLCCCSHRSLDDGSSSCLPARRSASARTSHRLVSACLCLPVCVCLSVCHKLEICRNG